MLTLKDFKGQAPAWCPGCGNFSILRAFNEAMVELELPPPKILIVSGIARQENFLIIPGATPLTDFMEEPYL